MPGLWYRGENRAADGIVTLVHGNSVKILLVLRNNGFWAFPGGFVDENQFGKKQAEKTARREILEETSLCISDKIIPEYIGYYADIPVENWVSTHVFYYALGNLNKLPLVTHENDPDIFAILQAKWWNIEDVINLDWYSNHFEIFCDFMRSRTVVKKIRTNNPSSKYSPKDWIRDGNIIYDEHELAIFVKLNAKTRRKISDLEEWLINLYKDLFAIQQYGIDTIGGLWSDPQEVHKQIMHVRSKLNKLYKKYGMNLL